MFNTKSAVPRWLRTRLGPTTPSIHVLQEKISKIEPAGPQLHRNGQEWTQEELLRIWRGTSG